MKDIVLGSLSSGTMKVEDLTPIFVNEILRIDSSNEVANKIWSGYSELEDENDLDGYWESEGASWDLDDLFDELNDLCCDLPYISFGSHPDDGADYGFWVNWEALYFDTNNKEVIRVDKLPEIVQDDRLYLVGGLSLYKGSDLVWTCM